MERNRIALLLILFTSSAHAEVSDKIASVSGMWVLSLSFGFLVSLLTLWNKWFFLLAVAFSALYISATADLAADQNLAASIIIEQGNLYFAQGYITSLIPPFMAGAAFLYALKRKSP